MRSRFTLLIVLFAVVVGPASALETNRKQLAQRNFNNMPDRVHPASSAFTRDDPDTIYFGGDDGAGNPFEGGIWDFDTITSDPFQGWTSIDRTANNADYFDHVTAEDFAAHGDPCTPMINGTAGQLWVGIHEDEANERDFVNGMGYQNNMCQSAFSPLIEADPATNDIDIIFTYFNDTEAGYDYTYLYISCFDSSDQLMTDGRIELTYFSDIIGSYLAPEIYELTISAGSLPAGTAKIQIELLMKADFGYSDEDGNYNSACGPFAVDDLSVTIGSEEPISYDFDDSAQGWTFSRCPGVGAFMAICPEAVWAPWLEEAGVMCDCNLSGNALDFNDYLGSPYDPPGHPAGQEEEAVSSIVSRAGYDPDLFNIALMTWTDFLYLPRDRGTFYRIGYKMYPFSSEVNPTPHWSARRGQNTWYYVGQGAVCSDNIYNLSTLMGSAGDPLPNSWTELRIVFETTTSCYSFGLPPSEDEGNNHGAPLIDNLCAAITSVPDAPVITYAFNGASFHDGFGQHYPDYLEPCDVGNSNVALDISPYDDPGSNSWLGDTAIIMGPPVSSSDPLTQWQASLCFKLTHIGPRQHLIPGFAAWKARLSGDPELEFCCVYMDSLETSQGAFANKFVTFAREDDPYFDIGAEERSETQEILPDGVFAPGTGIEYYYSASWVNVPDAEEYIYPAGHAEFEILPRMRTGGGGEYTIEWPSCLYVDAFNRGAEYYINPALDLLGFEFDRYDYLDASQGWHAPMARSFCEIGPHNPGGYGNNGCTLAQLMGYRLIFVNTGTLWGFCMARKDWVLFKDWLGNTGCDSPSFRRGIIFDGDGIASAMYLNTLFQPDGSILLNNYLGATLVTGSYRDYTGDDEYCVSLGAAASPEFEMECDTRLYGNGCPTVFDYDVLGIQGSVPGVTGNLIYDNGVQMNPGEYAQVLRDNTAYPYNWRSVINGFSVHHLSKHLCGGVNCSSDSACVVEGIVSILRPAVEWIQGEGDPFDPWRGSCIIVSGVEDNPVNHSPLEINFLRGATPNPFRSSATIRFSLADAGNVDFSIYDVSGRLVKAMGENAFEAGENSVVWDGTNTNGNRVGGGIYWMQMNTDDGFSSGKKMIVLK